MVDVDKTMNDIEQLPPKLKGEVEEIIMKVALTFAFLGFIVGLIAMLITLVVF